LLAIYSTLDETIPFVIMQKQKKTKQKKKSYKAFKSFMAKIIWKKNDLEADTCTKIFEKKLSNNILIDMK
jgi:hypothetical protein